MSDERVGRSTEARDEARPDPALAAALDDVLRLLGERHDLDPHQLLALASELQRYGVERLVEERIGPLRRRAGNKAPRPKAGPEE